MNLYKLHAEPETLNNYDKSDSISIKNVFSDFTNYRDLDGEYHREDGPAVEDSNGYKAWFINGERHRVDGPAIECSNGYKAWYLNDQLHREDGPAVEYENGDKFWYLNGNEYSEEEFKKRYEQEYLINKLKT